MNLPFTHPWLLAPFAAGALATLGLALWAHQQPGLGVQVVGQRPLWQGLGMALVLAGLGIGLAEPRWGSQGSQRLTVHVVLDASRSMSVQDVGGRSRWEAALATLDRLWARPQVGFLWSLDLLTGDAIPLQPPGEDRRLLRDSLRVLAPGEVGSPGTSLARGLSQVAAQADPDAPAIILLLSDGEETWQTPDEALDRSVDSLRKARLPLFALAFGDGLPHGVPPRPESTPNANSGANSNANSSTSRVSNPAAPPPEPVTSTANPEFLARLAQATGGQLYRDSNAATAGLQALATGTRPLPILRSQQPAHPEVGAWVALGGLALWLLFAGKPMTRWRPVLLLMLGFASPALRAEDPGTGIWAPVSVKAWLAHRALEDGDLTRARRWRPAGNHPSHMLLAAQIDLKTGRPEEALKTLAPLVGQGSPRPLPGWRVPALMLAARAQVEARRPEEARALLERLLLEQPGQREAIHDLQTLVKDATPPPPPNPKKPPPPPPPRPSLGAQQDELEGLKQRLPKPPKVPGGVKDL